MSYVCACSKIENHEDVPRIRHAMMLRKAPGPPADDWVVESALLAASLQCRTSIDGQGQFGQTWEDFPCDQRSLRSC